MSDNSPTLRNGFLQIMQDFPQNVITVNVREAFFPAFSGLPQLTHAFEKGLHPLSAFNRVADELIGILAELAFVLPGKELGIARDHAERLLEVVGSRVREVLEVLVHPP